jgi:hypothetical protein
MEIVYSADELTASAASHSCIDLKDLNVEEGFRYFDILFNTPVWEAGSGDSDIDPIQVASLKFTDKLKALESWRLPRGSLPLLIAYLYTEILEQTCIVS